MNGSFEQRLQANGLLDDPYLFGESRVDESPVVLSRSEASAYLEVGERIAEAYDELARVVHADPDLADSFFALTPCQRLLWLASCPLWHGYARVDVFETDQGLKITELNSDTPTGHAEAAVLGAVAKEAHPAWIDPNEGLGAAIVTLLRSFARTVKDAPKNFTIGLVYPTDLTEDLPLVRLVSQWFARAGHKVVTGSPYNIARGPNGGITLFGERVHVILRHYKTDWWTERTPVWSDAEPFDDALPLAGPLERLVSALLAEEVALVNPFGAVLTQNKRSLAFFWEHFDRFSPATRKTIEAHVPYTVRLESLPLAQVVNERERWVMKSDYGCEGDEVIVGKDVTVEEWREALLLAMEGRWVVQERFTPRTSETGHATNMGVFVVGGQAAGLYARTEAGPTSVLAKSRAVLIEEAS